MRSTLLAGLVASLSLGLVVPAFAGTVYVPLVADATVDGVTYRSRLVVSNTSTEPRFFVLHFVETFANGTERDFEAQPQVIGVAPGATYVYDGIGVAAGKTGMLEITGDDALVFQASVVTRSAGVDSLPAQLPILDDDRWVAAGEVMVVEGLRRDAQRVSALGLLNLEPVATTCTMILRTAVGQPAVDAVTLSLAPLSQSFFADALGGAGIQSAADMRFEVTCAGRAYAFGMVVDTADTTLTTLDLATRLDSALVAPGEEPDPGVCEATSVCLELPGTFHVATNTNRSFRRKIPIAAGRTFRRIELAVTVTHGGWDKKYPNGIHNVFWLFSQKFAGATWAYANARGPNRNLLSLSHNIGLGVNQNSRSTADFALVPGTTYHVRYLYDTIGDVVECVWSTPEGVELARMSDRPTVDVVTFQGDGFELWFGIEGAHQIEVPSIGWAFSDARIEFSN